MLHLLDLLFAKFFDSAEQAQAWCASAYIPLAALAAIGGILLGRFHNGTKRLSARILLWIECLAFAIPGMLAGYGVVRFGSAVLESPDLGYPVEIAFAFAAFCCWFAGFSFMLERQKQKNREFRYLGSKA